MKRFMGSYAYRLVAISATLALMVLALAFSNASEDPLTPAVDSAEHAYLMAFAVRDVYDLEQHFALHQNDFLPIVPPFADFILNQSGLPAVIPFEVKGFPEVFNAQLVGVYENSVPVYPLTILEDPTTREIIFINADGKEMYTLPPVQGYDPFAFLKTRRPTLYAGRASWQAINYWESIYDPARV